MPAARDGRKQQRKQKNFWILSRTLTNSRGILFIVPVFKFLSLRGAVKTASGPGTDARTVCGQARGSGHSILLPDAIKDTSEIPEGL